MKNACQIKLADIIAQHGVSLCLECGKCSAVCPITPLETRAYGSPRLLVENAIAGHSQGLFENPLFWSCLTCKRCSQLCPSAVSFAEFIRDTREMAQQQGRRADCTHGGVVQTWGRLMTDPDIRQRRLAWLDDGHKTGPDSDTLLFVGCLPYYAEVFEHLGVEGVSIARAAVKLLNHLGIRPQVLSDERCCGHDQLWSGDRETFRALARINHDRILATGVKRIVTTCPECARTLAMDYPRLMPDFDLEVKHLSQLLAESWAVTDAAWQPDGPVQSVTYQDACRLGRHLGQYDAPRAVIARLGVELIEMDHNRQSAMCCGTSCWQACGRVNKSIQTQRLSEAAATGTQVLITPCIKCQIHLRCAQKDIDSGPEMDMAIRDLTTFAAERVSTMNRKHERKQPNRQP